MRFRDRLRVLPYPTSRIILRLVWSFEYPYPRPRPAPASEAREPGRHALAPASLRPWLHIYVRSLHRFEETLNVVEIAADINPPDFVDLHRPVIYRFEP